MDFIQNTFVLPDDLSLDQVQKELDKQKGAFLGYAQAYPFWPLEIQKRMTLLRLAMLSTVIQNNLNAIYNEYSDTIRVTGNFDEDQESILTIVVSGPRTADVIEGIENELRASKIHWRQWSIEFIGSTAPWLDVAQATASQFWTWTGVAFLRDQERRSFDKDISRDTRMNLFTDLYLQGLKECPGAPKSFAEWSNQVYETKRQLATDASLKNLSQDFLQYICLRQLQNAPKDANIIFDLLCKCNFQRRMDQILPSSYLADGPNMPPCQIWAASVECFALSLGAEDLQEKSFFALLWTSYILKLEKDRQCMRDAALCEEVYNLSKYAQRGAYLSDKNSNAHQLQDVERVVKNLPRVLLHDLVQTK